MRSLVAAGAALIGLLAAPAASANTLWNYFKQYQLGFDYTSSQRYVNATYEVDGVGTEPREGCSRDGEEGKDRCSLTVNGGSSSGWGVFLQRAFKRQGDWHFDYDLGFGLRWLSGSMTAAERARQKERGLPLEEFDFSLLAFLTKAYIQFGITPAKTWPDVLISIGPSAQIAVGEVGVNGEKEQVAIATRSSLLGGFFELEIVLWRFGDGALSLFSNSDFTGNDGTKLYPKEVDGMSEFRGSFGSSTAGSTLGMGLKILLDWP